MVSYSNFFILLYAYIHVCVWSGVYTNPLPPLGSTTIHPYNDPTLTPIELGASIFVRANKNLWRATDEFGLARVDFADSGSGEDTMGIWDGAEFRLMVRLCPCSVRLL